MIQYPLEGDYSLRFKVTRDGNSWNNRPYGGIVQGAFLEYRPRLQNGSRESLATLNGRLTSSLNNALRLSQNTPKPDSLEFELRREGNQISFFIKDTKLAHADLAGSSFPFAGLLPLPAYLESVEIKGTPKIPRSVALLNETFSGWSARRYERMLTNVLPLYIADQPAAVGDPSPSHLASWKLENGELHSDGNFAATDANDPQVAVRVRHNCLLYGRPLLDGERFEYEVWQDKDTPAASPVIGLTALLIEDKIRLHWLPTAREVQSCGISVDNRGDDPQAEQLHEAKLNDNQWNKVSLRIEGQRLTLAINGTDVYRRPLPTNTPQEFGWLSIPSQPSVRIRNATLSGNWPEQLPTDLWEKR
jgi:hypothetical protein